jgi:hypothetical protein
MSEKYFFNQYKDRKFTVETEIIPGNTSRGVATVLGSFKNICWGELRTGQAVNYHIFNLITEGNQVTECKISNAGHWENKNGSVRMLGTMAEVQTLFEVMQGNFLEAEKLKEIKEGQKQNLAEIVAAKEKKGQEIKAARENLKAEFQKLSESKSISEQLSDMDLQKLAAKLSLFNLLYPERIKR